MFSPQSWPIPPLSSLHPLGFFFNSTCWPCHLFSHSHSFPKYIPFLSGSLILIFWPFVLSFQLCLLRCTFFFFFKALLLSLTPAQWLFASLSATAALQSVYPYFIPRVPPFAPIMTFPLFSWGSRSPLEAFATVYVHMRRTHTTHYTQGTFSSLPLSQCMSNVKL